jgi:hypothetical protein
MNSWNFEKQLADLIESRKKNITIQAMRKDERDPLVGELVDAYTGIRTKHCRLMGNCRIVLRRYIEISPKQVRLGPCRRFLRQRLLPSNIATYTLNDGQVEFLAIEVGFESVAAFWGFYTDELTGYLYEFGFSSASRTAEKAGDSH